VTSARARTAAATDSRDQRNEIDPLLRREGTSRNGWQPEGADRLRLPADLAEIPTRVPLTSLLLGGAPYPRQANGAYEVRVEEETVRVEVDAGQIHAAPESVPDTTIELTRPGLRSLILGARASEIEQAGGPLDPRKPATRPRLAQHPHRTAATSRAPPTTRSRRRRHTKGRSVTHRWRSALDELPHDASRLIAGTNFWRCGETVNRRMAYAAHREVRPPLVRKSRSASVGAMAAARS